VAYPGIVSNPPRSRGALRGAPRLDEVAGSPLHELTLARRSLWIHAVKAAIRGASHGPLCDRSGRKEIPTLHPQPAGRHCARGTVRYLVVAGVLSLLAADAGDRRDLGGGLCRRRSGESGGPRGGRGPRAAGEAAE